ncbi:hypothetical protein Cni_G11242 [Canna indica]|uniref:Uncharacterized protein n=1 Tax=Canna indica TaxID=4628 RepID=A0AAQ3K5P4_9LILI|nr:hypothetical protein Cni_G11242 [Canna indica]
MKRSCGFTANLPVDEMAIAVGRKNSALDVEVVIMVRHEGDYLGLIGLGVQVLDAGSNLVYGVLAPLLDLLRLADVIELVVDLQHPVCHHASTRQKNQVRISWIQGREKEPNNSTKNEELRTKECSHHRLPITTE